MEDQYNIQNFMLESPDDLTCTDVEDLEELAFLDIEGVKYLLSRLKPEYAAEADVEQLVPLLPEMVTDIINGNYNSENYEMLTGASLYEPMGSEDVHNLIEEIFTPEIDSEEIEEEYGTSDNLS